MVGLLFVGLLLTAAVLAAVQAVDATYRQNDRDLREERVRALGENLLTLAAAHIWDAFLLDQEGDQPTPEDLRAWLSTYGLSTSPVTPQAAQAAALEETPGSEWPHDLLGGALPQELGLTETPEGVFRFAGVRVTSLRAARRDIAGGAVLSLSAGLEMVDPRGGRREVEVRGTWTMSRADYRGLEYAVLTRDVGCILCHTKVDSAQRRYNLDPERYGTFPGVKVGSIEGVRIRLPGAHSRIAGTLHTGGPLMNRHGGVVNSLPSSALEGVTLDEDGLIVEDEDGDLLEDDIQILQASAQNPLPDGFPAVIPDENHNRMVDPEETQTVAAGATGSLGGGIRVAVPQNGSISTFGLPETSNMGTLEGTHAGHLLAVGTAEDPLTIQGRVLVDGDIALAGVVQGSGEIIATGNVYILGSLTYGDGEIVVGEEEDPERTFGIAHDGMENRLAIGAGGSILIGNYRRSSHGIITGQPGGPFNFTLSQMALFNRAEWTRTQPTLPGPGGTTVPNPLYDPTHVARYYTLQPGDPAYVFQDPNAWFDPVAGVWRGPEAPSSWNQILPLPPGSAAWLDAVITPLDPRDGWITLPALLSLYWEFAFLEEEESLRVDAMLYTNNGILAPIRRHSVYDGRLRVNGGLVAPDLGVLASRGLRVNHDERQRRAFSLKVQDGPLYLRRILMH